MDDSIENNPSVKKLSEIEERYKSVLEGFSETMYRKFREGKIIGAKGGAGEDKTGKQLQETETPPVIPNSEKSSSLTSENINEIQNLRDFVSIVYSVASVLKLEAWDNLLDILLQLDSMKVFKNQDSPIWDVLKEEFGAPSHLNDDKIINDAINKMKPYKIQVLPYISWLLEFLSISMAKQNFSNYEFETGTDLSPRNFNRFDFIALSYTTTFPDILFEIKYRRKNVDAFKDILLQSVEDLRDYNNVTKRENILIQILYTSEQEFNFNKIRLEFNKTLEEQFPEYIGRIIYLPISITKLNGIEGEFTRLESTIDQVWNKSNVFFKDAPYVISKEDNYKIYGSFITKPVGSFATWVQVSSAKKIGEEIANNRYIIAHDTNQGISGKSDYLNVWAIRLMPDKFNRHVDNKVRWDFWITNDIEEGYQVNSPELDNSEFEWYHLLLRWNHSKPSVELLVNGKTVEIRADYFKFWPKRFEKTLRIGNWTKEDEVHYLNMPLYRMVISENYLSDLWLNNELGNNRPDKQSNIMYSQINIERDTSGVVLPTIEYADYYLIKYAEYGFGKNFKDVTLQIRKMIQENKLQFIVSNEIFGDSSFGNQKALLIKCIINGKEQSISITENGVLDFKNYLPRIPSKDL